MPKRAVFERSPRELSLDVSVGVHILSVVEQSSLESRSRGCAKTSDTCGMNTGGGWKLSQALCYAQMKETKLLQVHFLPPVYPATCSYIRTPALI